MKTPQTATAGRLEVLCGPMFSGKTTELIRRLGTSSAQGERVVAIKPVRDDRYAAAELVTHSGQRLAAVAVGSAVKVMAASAGYGVVGIDEGHFFGTALIGPCGELVSRGVRVIVAGVERDHRGRPFEPFPTLLCEADEVVKMSGPCAVCGRPAVHSQRMTGSDEAIVVGGAGMYQARCRGCFEGGTGISARGGA